MFDCLKYFKLNDDYDHKNYKYPESDSRTNNKTEQSTYRDLNNDHDYHNETNYSYNEHQSRNDTANDIHKEAANHSIDEHKTHSRTANDSINDRKGKTITFMHVI